MGNSSSTADLHNSKEAQFIKTTIVSHKVVIFSKTHCSYCHTAKAILHNIGAHYRAYELDRMDDGPILQEILGAMTKARTVPRVFINGVCIGGCSELQALARSGRLRSMLKDHFGEDGGFS